MLEGNKRATFYANEAIASFNAGQANIPGSPANQAGLGIVSGGGGEGISAGADLSGMPPLPPIVPSGDDGGRRPGRGVWNALGKGGQALYGMYIAKRMFGMFGGIGTEKIEQYASAAAAAGPMDFYGQSDYELGGAATYQAAASRVNYLQGEGAYGMWGKPMQAFNEFLGARPALARGVAAAGSAAALGASGMLLSSGLMPSLVGEATALAIAPAAPFVAGAAVAGVATYWGLNEIQEAETKRAEAIGGVPVDIWEATKHFAKTGIAMSWGRTPGGGPSEVPLEPGDLAGETPSKTLRMAEAMVGQVGGQATVEEMLPTLQQAAQMMGKSPADLTEEEQAQIGAMYQRGEGMGIQGPQYMAQSAQYAGAIGLYEGTPEYFQAAQAFSQLGQVEQQKQLGQAQMASQRGAQLAPYMGGQKAGLQAARGMDPFEVRATVSLLEMFGTYGGDIDALAGYEEARAEGVMPSDAYGLQTYAQELAAVPLGALAKDRAGQLAAPMLEEGIITPEELAPTLTRLGEKYGNLPPKDFKRLAESAFVFSAGMRDYTPDQYDKALGGLQEKFGGYSEQQWQLTQQVLGGDLRAASWAAQTEPGILTDLGMNVQGAQLFDPSGNRIFETSGTGMMRMIESQAQMGTPAAMAVQNRAGTGSYMTQTQKAGNWMGVSAGPMLDSYMAGGTRGAQDYARDRGNELNQASAGIAARSVALQEEFLWGGGAWTGTPAAGSMWDIQDRQRQLGHRSQMASFASSRQRADMSNQFGIRQEELNLGRMGATQGYQREQFGMQWASMQQSRGWAREDWAMEDTVRGFQTGWQMEDINEQLRFAGGRERRQLLKQRDRATTMQNLDEQQITTSRGRQEEVWAKEDERFQKQVEYAEKMMDYDRQQWANSREQRESYFNFERKELNRSMDEYKKRYKLEGEMIELQRDHQAAMLALQKESAGIQAEQARIQHDLDKILTENSRTWGDIEGYLGNINNYDNVSKIAGVLAAMMGQMANLSPGAINDLVKMFGLMQTVPATGWFNKIAYEKAKFD